MNKFINRNWENIRRKFLWISKNRVKIIRLVIWVKVKRFWVGEKVNFRKIKVEVWICNWRWVNKNRIKYCKSNG